MAFFSVAIFKCVWPIRTRERLGAYETEDLFRAHRVFYPIKTSSDDDLDNASLPSRR